MRPVGFSTGALGLGDLDRALVIIREHAIRVIEFSALRWPELELAAARLKELSTGQFKYVSFHAPSVFSEAQEPILIKFLLAKIWHHAVVIVHPDSIHDSRRWRVLGGRLALENTDKRKPGGQTSQQLAELFAVLPEALFCFDIGHARQWDPSMTEAFRLLRAFADRMVQVHISDVTSDSRHGRLSDAAILAFGQMAKLIPDRIPLIVESVVAGEDVASEVESVQRALPVG